jgi:hypothetical protein
MQVFVDNVEETDESNSVEHVPTTLNECNDDNLMLTVEAPSKKMPIVNRTSTNSTKLNSTNNSRIGVPLAK